MRSKAIFSNFENKKAVVLISQQIMEKIDPDELETAGQHIGPLIDMAAMGQVSVSEADEGNQDAALGGEELLIAVVVPIVVEVLTKLSIKLGETVIERFAEKWKRQDKKEGMTQLATLVKNETQIVIMRTRSKKGDKWRKRVEEITTFVITRHLQN